MSRVIVKLFTLKEDISRTLFLYFCIQEHSWAFRPILFLSTKKNPSMKKVEKLILLKVSAVEFKKNPHEARTRKSTVENRHRNPPPLSHCCLRLNNNFGLHTHKDIQWISPFLYKKFNLIGFSLSDFLYIHIENVRECHLWTIYRFWIKNSLNILSWINE